MHIIALSPLYMLHMYLYTRCMHQGNMFIHDEPKMMTMSGLSLSTGSRRMVVMSTRFPGPHSKGNHWNVMASSGERMEKQGDVNVNQPSNIDI